MRFVLSKHAQFEMSRRGIAEDVLRSVLENPQQIVPEHSGRNAYQSQMDFGQGKTFLLRAIVIDRVNPAIVVTVYRTTKVGKYWRTA